MVEILFSSKLFSQKWKFSHKFSISSVFFIAKIFHQGLLKIKGEINKESIIDGIESLKGADIGLGQAIYFDKKEHQAMHKLWLVSLKKGQFKSFDWSMMLHDDEVND